MTATRTAVAATAVVTSTRRAPIATATIAMEETVVAQTVAVEATAVAATTGRRAGRRPSATAQMQHLPLVMHRRRVTTPTVVLTIEVVEEVGSLA